MTSRARAVGLCLIGVVVTMTIGFVLLQAPFRALETATAAALLRALGAHRVQVVQRTSIFVVPLRGGSFRAIVSPSCSSIASLLAIACLASLTPRYPWRRRVIAVGAALATVALGNILRIAGSIGVGFLAGRSSLVLFHDWVGSVFTFGYTLGGFILMLYLLLPATTPEPVSVAGG